MDDARAAGLVAIGGKHPRKGISVGVDEEIALASKAGVPAFLIGSVQGRSSRLGAELSRQKWKDSPNRLVIEGNEQLRKSPDYGSLADIVLNSVGI